MSDFEIRFLSSSFYTNKFPKLREALEKQNRPYYVLLVKIKNGQFALPLRTNLKHDWGFKTVENGNGGYKGIDYSKAVLVTPEDLDSSKQPKLSDKQEYLMLIGNIKTIKTEFKKFVSGYITAIKNDDKNILETKYKFATLCNYHKELKID